MAGAAARAGRPHATRSRRVRRGRCSRSALPVAAVVLPLALLFPEGGFEPYPAAVVRGDRARRRWRSCGRCRPAQRLLRVGALVYLLALRAVPGRAHADGQQHRALRRAPGRTAARCARSPSAASAPASAAGARAPAGALALCVIAVWVAWGPVRETLAVAGNESTQRLLLRARRALPGPRRGARRPRRCGSRCRSPARTGRRRCSRRRVSLARGWEKQLDTRFDQRAARARPERRRATSAGCTSRPSPMSRSRTRRSIPRAPRRAA